jgi:hypothetical protein
MTTPSPGPNRRWDELRAVALEAARNPASRAPSSHWSGRSPPTRPRSRRTGSSPNPGGRCPRATARGAFRSNPAAGDPVLQHLPARFGDRRSRSRRGEEHDPARRRGARQLEDAVVFYGLPPRKTRIQRFDRRAISRRSTRSPAETISPDCCHAPEMALVAETGPHAAVQGPVGGKAGGHIPCAARAGPRRSSPPRQVPGRRG